MHGQQNVKKKTYSVENNRQVREKEQQCNGLNIILNVTGLNCSTRRANLAAILSVVRRKGVRNSVTFC